MNKNFSSVISPKNISIAIVVITISWIASGVIFGNSREEIKNETLQSGGEIAKIIKVENLTAQEYTRKIIINGHTEANRIVEIKPEVDGKVIALPVKKGSNVAANQLIVQLDNRDRKEKLAEAKAMVEAREIEYKAARELLSKGYRPRIGFAESKAALEQARVALAQAQLAFDNTMIKTPFAGRLDELNVEIGDFVLSGFVGSMNNQTMALVVEDNPLIISGRISEKDLSSIDKNAIASINLASGRELNGKIRYISQMADTESRSFKVEVEVENNNHDVPLGATATIMLPASLEKAYQLSSSVLALDDSGKVGVKILGDDSIVKFAPVEIISDDENGIWIAGLPDKINLVVKGQAFVNSGQKIPESKNQ